MSKSPRRDELAVKVLHGIHERAMTRLTTQMTGGPDLRLRKR